MVRRRSWNKEAVHCSLCNVEIPGATKWNEYRSTTEATGDYYCKTCRASLMRYIRAYKLIKSLEE